MTSADHSGRKDGKAPHAARELGEGAAVLRVLRGFYAGLEVPMDRERIVIGRGREADLAVAEPTISRQHAAIAWDGEGYVLEDLGSTNGTRVNGRKATRARLLAGDEIELGRLQLRLQAPGMPERE
jgi:pSer/pThr/pTyr-binding forkhead associated (FHA) protein